MRKVAITSSLWIKFFVALSVINMTMLIAIYRYNETCVTFSIGSSASTHDSTDLASSLRPTQGSADMILKQHPACVHPQLDLWSEEISKFYGNPDYQQSKLDCSSAKNWVSIRKGVFHIDPEANKEHGQIQCHYKPITRIIDDFHIHRGESKKIRSGHKVVSDFIEVECKASDGNTYRNIHSNIIPRKHIQNRYDSSGTVEEPLNVLMFGFDSSSALSWRRNLQKSHRYFMSDLGATMLNQYNVVGDATTKNLHAILTGHFDTELPEARRGFKDATHVDSHPWIWDAFKREGYVTQWGEDASDLGTFTFRMIGFEKQPVDYYMRTFYMAAEKLYSQHSYLCLGSTPRHLNMLNWIREMYEAYPRQPKFSFLFHSELTHDSRTAVRYADQDVMDLLQEFEKLGHLNNTVLILMGDHGPRYTKLRETWQGKYEERLPYMGIRFPPWFSKKYPGIKRNLEINSERLTTPFDIHQTLVDILRIQKTGIATSLRNKNGSLRRGLSLLNEVPTNRTCRDAGIEPHWCACLDWKTADTSNEQVMVASQHLVKYINRMLLPHDQLCAKLHLKKVASAEMFTDNEKVLAFKESADDFLLTPNLSDDMNSTFVLYQAIIEVEPSQALFEGTVHYDSTNQIYTVKSDEISRINIYGDQPICLSSNLPHLRKYCYCKKDVNSPT